MPEVTKQLINNKESFATKIKNTRNYFIHYTKKKKSHQPKPKELS